MSTRGVVARPTADGGFEGVYCHWDNYPSGRGKLLWDCYHRRANVDLQGDLEDMARFFIDEHPGGWSTVGNVDDKPGDPAYDPTRFWSQGRYPGACYCHRADNGERGPEPAAPVRNTDAGTWCEYAYVLKAPHEMLIYAQRSGQWRLIAAIDLDGPEPDWKRLNGD